MQLSVPEVSDLSTEKASTLKAYGVDDGTNPIKAGFAKNCILADDSREGRAFHAAIQWGLPDRRRRGQ